MRRFWQQTFIVSRQVCLSKASTTARSTRRSPHGRSGHAAAERTADAHEEQVRQIRQKSLAVDVARHACSSALHCARSTHHRGGTAQLSDCFAVIIRFVVVVIVIISVVIILCLRVRVLLVVPRLVVCGCDAAVTARRRWRPAGPP